MKDTVLRVRYGETDQMGVVYHSNYFRYFEVARSDFFRHLGYTYKQLEGQGLMLPLTSCQCDFKKPAKYDDEVHIKTTIKSFKGARIVLAYEAFRHEEDGSVTSLVTGSTSHAFANVDLKPINIKKENQAFYDLIVANM